MAGDTDSVDQQQLMSQAQQFIWLGSYIQRWAMRRTPAHNAHGLSFSQVGALYLIQNGIGTAGAMAREMQITPRAVTSIVDVLIEKALVSRTVDAGDRRRAILRATPAGLELSKSIEETALEPLSDFLARRPHEDRQSFERTLALMSLFIEAIPGLD